MKELELTQLHKKQEMLEMTLRHLREKEELEVPLNDSNANLRRPLLTPI